MFTGIIEGTGKVKGILEKDGGRQLEIAVDFDLERANLGESIAVNGCCLTITSRLGNTFWADISPETLQKTTLRFLQIGDAVNLERSLKMGERLGGHFVQGHVDGLGEVWEMSEEGNCKKITFLLPWELSRYIVEKGSIAIDGISLTVNRCWENYFSVMCIPHTQTKTTFEGIQKGTKVNLEVDILGKYIEKLTHLDSEEYQREGSKVTEAFLKKHGF